MKRTTVYLKEEMDLALSQIAKRRGQAKAEIVREALAALVEQEDKNLNHDIPSWLGAGDSGGIGRAESDDEVLLELLEQEHEEILADWEARKQAHG